MNRSKPRKFMSASQQRAIATYTAEAKTASGKSFGSESNESTSGIVAVNVPTVVRRVVEIVPVTGLDKVPQVFQDTIDEVSKQRRNANRGVEVQLFSRLDGRFASKTHGYSAMDLFERISGNMDELNHSPIDARVSNFSILGAKIGETGMRYVSAVLDEETRLALQFQTNIIRESVGLAPRRNIIPFHFSVFKSTDQTEAVEVLDVCRSSPAEYRIELASPIIRTVVQRDGPPKFR